MSQLVDDYRSRATVHDEFLGGDPAHRRRWADVLTAALGPDPGTADATADRLHRHLRDEDVTFHGTDGTATWALDPAPMLLEQRELDRLTSAIAQRAHLLDLVLADIHGERKLLTSGVIPPEIVLSHPLHSRIARTIPLPARRRPLHVAVDLARNADRSWTVLGERTGIPAGLGYALAGRRAMLRSLGSGTTPGTSPGTAPRADAPLPLEPFLAALAGALADSAPPGAGHAPSAAVLSPGPTAPTYADQVHLAAALGVPAVHRLRVAGGRVTARTPGGDVPVDVLLRHVPADRIDPLEAPVVTPGRSPAGTPGLVHAVRTGTVGLVNPLGAGVLESPALRAHLPRAARHLGLGELLLPSAVTYWCGNRSMCNHAMANLHRLVVRPVAEPDRPSLGWELSIAERAALAARIAAHPSRWVGEEPVDSSTTPTLVDGTLQPRATSLRLFAVQSTADCRVMPGGLGMASASHRATPFTLSRTTRAKDVWVVPGEPR